jgi:alpha-1,2-mannosyltransferase
MKLSIREKNENLLRPLTWLLITLAVFGYWNQYQGLWKLVPLHKIDLNVYRVAGTWIRHGVFLYQSDFWGIGKWTYTPFGALVMLPLALIPLTVLIYLWTWLSILCLAVILYFSFKNIIPNKHRFLFIIFLIFLGVPLTPVSDTLGLGQINLILGAMAIFDIMWISNNIRFPKASKRYEGFLIGIATAIKLSPGIFIIHYIFTKQYRAAFNATMTVFTCWGLAAIFTWHNSFYYFKNKIFLHVGNQVHGAQDAYFNQSLWGFFHRHILAQINTVYPVLALFFFIFGMYMGARLHKVGEKISSIAVIGLTGLIISPISWQHHAIWVIPALGAIVARNSYHHKLLAIILVIIMYIPARRNPNVVISSYNEQWIFTFIFLLFLLFALNYKVIIPKRKNKPSQIVKTA